MPLTRWGDEDYHEGKAAIKRLQAKITRKVEPSEYAPELWMDPKGIVCHIWGIPPEWVDHWAEVVTR